MAVAPTVFGGVVSGAYSRSATHYTGGGEISASGALSSSIKKCHWNGKVKVECDRTSILYMPSSAEY